MNQEELKSRLISVINAGLRATAISKRVEITYDTLAKFKQGKLYLLPSDAEKLDEYLSKVVIP